MKVCSKCGEEKPGTAAYFHRDKTRPDGLFPQCADCRRESERKRRVNLSKRPAFDCYDGTSKTCPSCGATYPRHKKYWYKHRMTSDGLRSECRRCSVAKSANRRQHDKSGDLTRKQMSQLWDAQGGRCHYTGVDLRGQLAHLDHIIPVSRGGKTTLSNMVWASPEANLSKNGSDVNEWARAHGIELKPHPITGEALGS